MKRIILITIFCISYNLGLAQTQEELTKFNWIDSIVTSNVPDLGNKYAICSFGQIKMAIKKRANDYVIYKLKYEHSIDDTIIVNNNTLDGIFANFTPESGVKRYLSETTYDPECVGAMHYLAIFDDNIKVFSCWLPEMMLCERSTPLDVDYPYPDVIYKYLIEFTL